MEISESKLKNFFEERFLDAHEDYESLYELCSAIVEANDLYDAGNAVAALNLIRDKHNLAITTKTYIEESVMEIDG